MGLSLKYNQILIKTNDNNQNKKARGDHDMFSAKRFRVLLADSGMTIKEFAVRSGITAYTIGQILNHGAMPKIRTIGKIARALQVSPAELMADE